MKRYLVFFEFKPAHPFPWDKSITEVRIIADNQKHAVEVACDRVNRTLVKRGAKDIMFKASKPIQLGREF